MSFNHLDQYARIESAITCRPPVSRLLATILLAIGAAVLPPGAWAQLSALAVLVVALAGLARIPPLQFVSRLAPPFAFVLLVSLGLLVLGSGTTILELGPLEIREDGLRRFGTATARAAVGIGAAVVLVSTTPFPELVDALRTLRMPAAVTTPLGLAYRFLYLLNDEVERLRRAASSRNARAGAAPRRRLLLGITAAAFQRTFDRSERVYQAMLLRGYTGTLRPLRRRPFVGHAGLEVALLAATVLGVVASAYR